MGYIDRIIRIYLIFEFVPEARTQGIQLDYAGKSTLEQSILTTVQFQELKRDLISFLEGRHKIVPINSLMDSRYSQVQPLYNDGLKR